MTFLFQQCQNVYSDHVKTPSSFLESKNISFLTLSFRSLNSQFMFRESIFLIRTARDPLAPQRRDAARRRLPTTHPTPQRLRSAVGRSFISQGMPNACLCLSAQGRQLARAGTPTCLADGPCPFGCWWLCAQAPPPWFVPREQTLQGSAWSWGSRGSRGSLCCGFSPASQVPCSSPGPEHPAAPRHWGCPSAGCCH